MHCVMVSHTHWDREWYRTFQSFRARLVDTVDRVLDLVRDDSGFHFQLDGQTIVLEDYLAVRPERRDELAAAVDAGRIAIGPWYVQPDSFLPSGEAHVRNLLEGRRVASAYGRCESVAYTPDSFGHPAQFPRSSPASAWAPSSIGAATGTRLPSFPPSTVGWLRTAARSSPAISARATSTQTVFRTTSARPPSDCRKSARALRNGRPGTACC